jgi:hypothetical protein
MVKHRLTVLGCGVALLGVAACGSSSKKATSTASGLTQAQFVAKADAICAVQKAQRAALKAPTGDPFTAGSATIKTFAPYLNSASTSLASALQKIRALGTPQTGAAQLQQSLAYGDQSAADQAAAGQAAASGNVTAFRADLVKLSKISPPAALKQFGFKVCGHR